MKASVLILAASFVCFAAAQCGFVGPMGNIDLSVVPTATLQIDQVFMGVKTPYTFVINLCNAVNQPPAGTGPCMDGAGYASQYSNTTCEAAFTTRLNQGWSYDATKGVGTASFTNAKGRKATINVGCGPTIELKAVGNVNTAYTFLLTTSAACGNPPPPVKNECDIGGSTVSHLGPTALDFYRLTMGRRTHSSGSLTPAMPPTLPRSTPLLAGATSGFIKQYSPPSPDAVPQ